MTLCIICTLRRLHSSRQINSEQQHPPSPDLMSELDDLRKFSLNSLMVLLTVLAVRGSKSTLAVVLGLLIYTISLRLSANSCFLQNHTTFSKFLHVVPLLATFCTAGVELVLGMHSSALAFIVLLLSALPLVTTIIHHGTRCYEVPLHVRVQDLSPAVIASSSV